MIETLITFGYVAGAVGLVCCIVGYFVFPKMIKATFAESKSDVTEE